MDHGPFTDSRYLLRRKILTLAGAKFHIFDSTGQLAFFSKLKAFKLKEDIRLYADESMGRELLSIQARQVIDFSAAYDVVDSTSGETVGALRRRGLQSIVRDEWQVLDPAGVQIGVIREDSTALALLRRFLTNLVPQQFHAEVNGMPVCTYKQHFNPFVAKIDIDFSPDHSRLYDRRLGIAAAILLCAIEGRQG